MEFFIIVIAVFVFAFIAEFFKKQKLAQNKNIQTHKEVKIEVVPEKEEKTTIINHNYYTQNNVYVQQNNCYKKSKSKNKDHSEKVWNNLGYRIKYRETFSYKMYGKEIFTPNQVEKIGSYQIKHSESGLAKKLLNNTGSKSHAKNILVNNYSLSESKAQKLLNNLNI
mgnify:CR=1 FL=1